MTLTGELSWQRLRRSAVPEIWLVPTENLNGLRDLTTPLSGMICYPCASTCCRQHTYQIWSLRLHSLRRWKAIQNVDNRGGLGSLWSLKVTGNNTNKYSTYEFLLAFHSNYVPILHCFWDIARYWSKIAVLTYPTFIWHIRWGWSRWNWAVR